jgi:hypothetical protein
MNCFPYPIERRPNPEVSMKGRHGFLAVVTGPTGATSYKLFPVEGHAEAFALAEVAAGRAAQVAVMPAWGIGIAVVDSYPSS